MNRRNVLTGLGGLAISGGALFGTGAFTSVSAERTVEVNVLTPSDDDAYGTDGPSGESDAIADQFVDVRIDAGNFSDVYVDDSDASTSESDLTPTSDNANSGASASEVSLIANDVTIRFGSDANPLLSDSDVTYKDLFIIDNADLTNNDSSDASNDEDFDVSISLDASDSGQSQFLNIGGSEGLSAATYQNGNTGNGGSPTKYDTIVDTQTGSDNDTLTMTITITPAST